MLPFSSNKVCLFACVFNDEESKSELLKCDESERVYWFETMFLSLSNLNGGAVGSFIYQRFVWLFDVAITYNCFHGAMGNEKQAKGYIGFL